MKKIAIVGCPSSGKTTLANKLGAIFNIPVHHLDKIFWVEKEGIKQDMFLAQQEEIMKEEKWIIDGGFTKSTSYDIRLTNADTIIFFSFSKILIYWRLLKRAIKYFNKVRPDMGGERRNHFNWHIIKYIWKYPFKKEHDRVLAYSKAKNVIVIHNSKEERSFLQNISSNTIH